MIQIENMTELEIIGDRLEKIDDAVNLIFETAHRMFFDRDKDETTPTLLLLTSMGAHTAALKAIHNKLKTQLEVLKDLESEEYNDSTTN